MARATLAAFAVASDQVEATLLAACRLTHGVGLVPLQYRLAHLTNDLVGSTNAAHWLGLAHLSAGMPSLAYRFLKIAAEGGVSLANVNIASLLGAGAVPAAGLALLDANSGPYNAASHQYPHAVRSGLEEQVQGEETRAVTIHQTGRAYFATMVSLIDEALEKTAPLNISSGRHASTNGGDYQVSAIEAVIFFKRLDSNSTEEAFSAIVGLLLPQLATIQGPRDGLLLSDSDASFSVYWFNDKTGPVAEKFSLLPS